MSRALLNGIHRVTAQSFCQIAKDHRRPKVEFSPRRWLTVGVLENGVRIPATIGTPQGAVISPLLAHVYLHYVLDRWVREWRQRHARGDVIVVRYADDTVIGFEPRTEAVRFVVDLETRMA